MNREFKDVLREIKFKYNITQAEIAERIGLTRSYLSEVVNGRAPYNESLKAKIKAVYPTLSCFGSALSVEESIRAFMQSKVYTVYDLAKILDIPVEEVTATIADGFTQETAGKWAETFGFSRNFLLTGEGQLFEESVPRIPLASIISQSGRLEDCLSSSKDFIISPVKDAELAITVAGDSMSPEFPAGSIVFVKRVRPSFIQWGKPYVLDTVSGAVLNYLSPGKDGFVKCLSANPSFAPFEVPVTDIFGMYRVLAVLCMK